MRPDLQRRIQRYGWDRAAPFYDTGWEEQLWPAQESLLAEADLQSGYRVLDVSCGTGLVTVPIAEIVKPEGTVTGIDLSEKMIAKARSRIENRGLKNVAFHHMDAEALDLPDNSFDTVICSLGLMYFPDPAMAIAEMYRVLKPGGQLAALVWGERKKCGWAEVFPIVDQRVKSDVCPLFFQLGTASNLQNEFAKTGLEKCESHRFMLPLLFSDDEEACTAAFWGGAVALAYQKFDEQTRNEINQEYMASIQSFKNGQSYSVPGEFVITTGRKPQEI